MQLYLLPTLDFPKSAYIILEQAILNQVTQLARVRVNSRKYSMATAESRNVSPRPSSSHPSYDTISWSMRRHSNTSLIWSSLWWRRSLFSRDRSSSRVRDMTLSSRKCSSYNITLRWALPPSADRVGVRGGGTIATIGIVSKLSSHQN